MQSAGDASSRYEDCFRNFDEISKIEKGNYLYLDATGNLKVSKTDQTSTSGSWGASLSKTVTNLTSGATGVKSDWQSVAKRIDTLNDEVTEILKDMEANPSRYRDDIKLHELSIKLITAKRGLDNLSKLYQEQQKSSWIASKALYKAEAAMKFDQQSHLLEENRQRIENFINQKGKEEDEADLAASAFGFLDEEELAPYTGNLDESFFLVQESNSKPIVTHFSESPQVSFIETALSQKLHTLSLNELKSMGRTLERELKQAKGNEERLLKASRTLKAELKLRVEAFKDFKHEFDKALKANDRKSIHTLIADLPPGLISEPKVARLIQSLPTSYSEAALKDLSSLQMVTAQRKINVVQETEEEETPPSDQQIRGSAILLHHRLNSSLEESFRTGDFEKNHELVKHLADNLLAADIWLKSEDRHPHMQTTLATAYRQLSEYYRGVGDKVSFEESLMKIGNIQLVPSHPLGDLKRAASRTQKDAEWVQVDGTEVRRRQVRVQLKAVTTPQEGKQQFLDLSFTLPRKERADFQARLKVLDGSPSFREQGITVDRFAKAEYPEYSFPKGAFKGAWDEKRIVVNTGDALVIRDNKIAVTIGNDIEKWNQYQKVSVQVDPKVTSQELHEFLSTIGLPMVLLESRPEDIHHENTARVAFARHPVEMAFYESPEECYQNSVENPENSNLSKTDAKAIVDRAKAMRLKDVGNNRLEYVDDQNVVEFWASGGRGFGATLGHSGVTFNLYEIYLHGGTYKKQKIENSAMTMAYILKGGQLSSMERFEKGIVGGGCCPDENVETGSANQVFTRPLTDNQFDSEHDWGNYAIEGNIFLLFDATLAERLPYGYTKDRAGLRNPHHISKKAVRMAQKELPEKGLTGELMKERQTLPQILENQRRSDLTLPTAEVMFEDTIGANYIYGAVVQTEEEKASVIRVLNEQGIDNIGGKPLDEAIFVGKLSPKMIKNPFEL